MFTSYTNVYKFAVWFIFWNVLSRGWCMPTTLQKSRIPYLLEQCVECFRDVVLETTFAHPLTGKFSNEEIYAKVKLPMTPEVMVLTSKYMLWTIWGEELRMKLQLIAHDMIATCDDEDFYQAPPELKEVLETKCFENRKDWRTLLSYSNWHEFWRRSLNWSMVSSGPSELGEIWILLRRPNCIYIWSFLIWWQTDALRIFWFCKPGTD